MNINDVDVKELWPTAVELYETENPLEIIFARQRELMEKYLVLEAVIMEEEQIDVPVDLHGAKDQRTLKARAWWFTEELAEAWGALNETNNTKFLEEMSDALHFLTELCILSGITPSTIETPNDMNPLITPSYTDEFLKWKMMDIIGDLGSAMWQLRNKPWKKSQVLTDIPRFTFYLQSTYKGLLRFLHLYFYLNMKEICLLYLRKSEVNKFRQRSNY